MLATARRALLYHAVSSWRAEPHIPPGARAFTMHRTSGVITLLLMAAVIALVETAVVHALVRRWSMAADEPAEFRGALESRPGRT